MVPELAADDGLLLATSPEHTFSSPEPTEQLVPASVRGAGILPFLLETAIPRIAAGGVDTQQMEVSAELLIQRNAENNGDVEPVSDLLPMLPGTTTAADLLHGFRISQHLDQAAATGCGLSPAQVGTAAAEVRTEFLQLFDYFSLTVNEMLQVQFATAHEFGRKAAYAECQRSYESPAERGSLSDTPTELESLASLDSPTYLASDLENNAAAACETSHFGDDLDRMLSMSVDQVDRSELSACYSTDLDDDGDDESESPSMTQTAPIVKVEFSEAEPSTMRAPGKRQPRASARKQAADRVTEDASATKGGSARAGKSRRSRPAKRHVDFESDPDFFEGTDEGTDGYASPSPLQRQKHECPHCEKCLDTKYKLARHVRTHTGEKPFKCEVCQVRFNQKSSLKTHSSIHAKATLRDPSTTRRMVENFTINGHTFDALGIPYAAFVYDAIAKQRST
jgi:hypothetical protein